MFFILLVGAVGLLAVNCQPDRTEATLANVPEDGRMSFMQLASKYGHPAVEHDVITTDGYNLSIFNMPGDRMRPVLLLHGLFDTADGWIIRGNASLAVFLADLGYDVWLINFRGSRYSRRHVSLDPDHDVQFWEFSVHEYAVHDLTACLDYVLNVTGQKQLSIVGFSEGTTATVVLGSMLPEYNDKVNVFLGLAPVVYLEHAGSLLAVVLQLSPFLNFIVPPNVVEVVGFNSTTKAILNFLCTQLAISYEVCYLGGFNALSGEGSFGINRKFFPVVAAHFPAGTSRKNLIHYSQIGLRKSFAQYDYGATKNLKVYHAFTPPVYDLSKFTMDTVLVSGRNDPVSTLKDVDHLKNKLPNVKEHKVMDRETFNHLDHLWADDTMHEYQFIADVLSKYNGR